MTWQLCVQSGPAPEQERSGATWTPAAVRDVKKRCDKRKKKEKKAASLLLRGQAGKNPRKLADVMAPEGNVGMASNAAWIEKAVTVLSFSSGRSAAFAVRGIVAQFCSPWLRTLCEIDSRLLTRNLFYRNPAAAPWQGWPVFFCNQSRNSKLCLLLPCPV